MDVSQYLEIFIDESAEHLQTLSDCIMELEKEPDNKDVINEIFRAAHSLKGMAGTMGFKRMQHLTHDMENVFQEVRSEKIQVDSQMIDLLFKCLDAIDGYLENIKATSDEGEEDNEVIIKELNNFLAKANGEAVAAEAAPAETEKEAAAPTDNGDHKLYLQIDLTDQERDAVMTAKDSGMHIYGMTVMIQKECLLKAARAFLVFREVEAFGEILVYRPSSQDIEDEKFEQEFSFYVASPESFDKIQNAAKNVSEIEDAVGEELTDFSPRVTETETEEKKEEKPADPFEKIKTECEKIVNEIGESVSEAYLNVSKVTNVGNSPSIFVADYNAFLRKGLSAISNGEEKAEEFAVNLAGGIVAGDGVPVSVKLLAVADKKFGGDLLNEVAAKTEELFTLFSSALRTIGKYPADYSAILALLKSL